MMVRISAISRVLVGVHLPPSPAGSSLLLRMSGVAEIRAGRIPSLLRIERPEVGRALSIEAGDLIATARGTKIEVCAAVPAVIGAFVSLDLYLIRPNRDRIIPEYLMAVLESAAAQAAFDAARQGSNLPRLPKAALENLPVPLPPLERQRTVVDLHRTLGCEARLLSELQAKHAVASAEFMRRAIAAGTSVREPIGSRV